MTPPAPRDPGTRATPVLRSAVSRRAMLAGLVGTVAVACGSPAPTLLVAAPDTTTPPPPPTATTPPSTTTRPPTSTTTAVRTTAAEPAVAPGPATRPVAAGLPRRVLAGYWPTWVPDAIRLRDLPAAYSMVHLFAAVPTGTDGTLGWTPPGDRRGAATHLREDVAFARSTQHRSVLLSVGGAGHGLVLSSRAVSTRLVDSVRRIVDGQLGGADGVDLNTFEADAVPDPTEYAWVSGRLKAAYGDGFLVTAPPAPWRDTDRTLCRDLARAGLIDLVGPQFYDGPGLTDETYIATTAAEWAGLVGPDRLYLGFGLVSESGDQMTPAACASAWKRVRGAIPQVRGAFCWNVSADEAAGWSFASTLGPLVAA